METARQILLFSFLTLCLVAFVGCKQKQEEAVQEEEQPRDTLIIEPLVGIGLVRFGGSRDEIIEQFGQPRWARRRQSELKWLK